MRAPRMIRRQEEKEEKKNKKIKNGEQHASLCEKWEKRGPAEAKSKCSQLLLLLDVVLDASE